MSVFLNICSLFFYIQYIYPLKYCQIRQDTSFTIGRLQKSASKLPDEICANPKQDCLQITEERIHVKRQANEFNLFRELCV